MQSFDDVEIIRSSEILRSARVKQLEGLFDLPLEHRSRNSWSVSLPLAEKDWNIGLIVGPSGSGKSTVAKELFAEDVVESFDWPQGAALVDAFPEDMGVKEICAVLSSVGFSSPPSWLRPWRNLSTGERFRADIARAIVEPREVVVMDEFSSVVDRTVARIGSAAVAKAVRRRGGRFIAVSCHYDIEDWLQPDWIYQPHAEQFTWRSLQRHPPINLEIHRVHRSAWRLFAHHHYLSSALSSAAKCFLGSVEGDPAVFTAVSYFPHLRRPGWKEHRTVCLPDFQGVGIGNTMSEFCAGLFKASGQPYRSTTSHPAMIRRRAKSDLWNMTHVPMRHTAKSSTKRSLAQTIAYNRLVASFEYVGEALPEEADAFGLVFRPTRWPGSKPLLNGRTRNRGPSRRKRPVV